MHNIQDFGRNSEGVHKIKMGLQIVAETVKWSLFHPYCPGRDNSEFHTNSSRLHLMSVNHIIKGEKYGLTPEPK